MTTLMQYLLACNVLDILTGFLKAYDQKNKARGIIKIFNMVYYCCFNDGK